jgi:hypothetical protein
MKILRSVTRNFTIFLTIFKSILVNVTLNLSPCLSKPSWVGDYIVTKDGRDMWQKRKLVRSGNQTPIAIHVASYID